MTYGINNNAIFKEVDGVIFQKHKFDADFVVGSPQLNDSTNSDHDARVFFDKDQYAFRAGKVEGGQWDTANRGAGSIGLGEGVIADKDNQVVVGKFNKVNNSIFQVGFGANDGSRKNAIEVTQSGSLKLNSDESIIFPELNYEPTPTQGLVYLDDGTNTGTGNVGFRVYSGGNWEDITGGGGVTGDMMKATYDPTNVNGDAFDMDNMVESATAKILTNNERSNISSNTTHRGRTDNPHGVDQADVGLGNVDNTSDTNKPISTATQAALNGKADSSHTHTVSDITNFASNLAGTTNTTPYTPTNDHNVATKKYVDDAIVAAGGYNDEQAQDAVGNILTDSSEIDFTYNDGTPSITAVLKSGSIDEAKLDASVNASLNLADSSVQPGDNISDLNDDLGVEKTSNKGVAGGYAELDGSGKVPASQLPSYVDDVLEYADEASFPATGEDGKIYVAEDVNKTFRRGGSSYVEIGGGGVALGETSGTAYRGDRGKTAYDHSQVTSGNPHNVTKANVGLGNVPNLDTTDAVNNEHTHSNKAILDGTQQSFTTALKNKLDGIEANADVTDTANVTSAGALMDSEITNLAQVKAFDSSDYATASQGTKADSALQSSDIGTSVQAYDNRTAKTDKIQFWTNTQEFEDVGIGPSKHTYFADVEDKGNSGTSQTMERRSGNIQKSKLTGNCTYTFSDPTGPGNYQLILEQDATGGRTATRPGTVKRPGGTAPTLSTAGGSIDVITFLYDGTNYLGVSVLDFS